ncbi:polyphosphate kinase 1 [Aminipila butyrica]|uniref:polyphosphate kinase 1 n=1 Tax=Aminipila butyrica TaxID=433296 RepID=UPI001FE43B4A|nr:polyphosphate kinase 1 [Aminipila butyrica]
MSEYKPLQSYTQNRELSWLRFNERVLDEACDKTVPLLERLKFISIFTSNLDEFFMIRVGSLFDLSLMDDSYQDNKSGMTANEQLEKVYQMVKPLYEKRADAYREVLSELKNYDIYSLEYHELTKNEQVYLENYFKTNINPILSPQIVDVHHPFPFMPNKSLFIAVLLKRKGQELAGILPMPQMLPELIFLPGNDVRFIKTEKILYHFSDKVFKKDQILEKNCICVTRNADIRFEDEIFELEEDFKARMVTLLHKRKKLSTIRLEAHYDLSTKLSDYFCDKLSITPEQVYITLADIKVDHVFSLFAKLSSNQLRQLSYAPFTPAPSQNIDNSKSILSQVKEKDLLLFYPFESMGSFLQMLKEAAADPKVISIKITIYRLARNSRLVDYLCTAAENGKEVTIVMELRARFDEHNNIDWSEKLENAGCRVLYGLPEYKIHSKVCLITYKEKNTVNYITQIGTGNYNETTAELYTDFSLLTADTAIGQDAVEFFKHLFIGNIDGSYNRLFVSPSQLKAPLLALIEKEIQKGGEGRIVIKINSLTDLDFINKLVEASRAGVQIKLLVRGICCILPGIPGLTENITVISVVGRFLEHSRVYSFGHGDDQKLYISLSRLNDTQHRTTNRGSLSRAGPGSQVAD